MTHNDAATTDKDPDDFDAWLWSAAPQAVDSSVDTPASAVQQPPPVTPLITETVTPPTAEYPSLSLLTSSAEIATWDDDAVYPPAESLMVDLPDDTLILTAVEFSDYGIEEIDENFGDTLELD